jgi:hypothetical protein
VTAIKPTLHMEDDLPFAEGQGQTAGPGTRRPKIYDLRKETTRTTEAAATAVVVVPEKKKRKRVATVAHVAVKVKKRAQPKAPEPSTATARFERYQEEQPGNYWRIPNEARQKDVLKVALQPQQQEEAYLTVLNKDNHVSVVHSLVRLESELRPSYPVKGKVAAFVGEVRLGLATPNLVVFEGEAEMFSLAVFPRVKFASVVDYHEVQEKVIGWEGLPITLVA